MRDNQPVIPEPTQADLDCAAFYLSSWLAMPMASDVWPLIRCLAAARREGEALRREVERVKESLTERDNEIHALHYRLLEECEKAGVARIAVERRTNHKPCGGGWRSWRERKMMRSSNLLEKRDRDTTDPFGLLYPGSGTGVLRQAIRPLLKRLSRERLETAHHPSGSH